MQFIHRLTYILGYRVTFRFKERQNKEQTVCLKQLFDTPIQNGGQTLV